jgi:hypothetical protein
MRVLAMTLTVLAFALLAPATPAQEACRFIKSRAGLIGYETGGPYSLDPFRLTKGRSGLREFLWQHWQAHKRGLAQAETGTVDRGTVKILYLIQPDAQGNWGIDVEIDRPLDPPCIAIHAESLIRLSIANPAQNSLSRTSGPWPSDKIPENQLPASERKNPKSYRVILVHNDKPITDAI